MADYFVKINIKPIFCMKRSIFLLLALFLSINCSEIFAQCFIRASTNTGNLYITFSSIKKKNSSNLCQGSINWNISFGTWQLTKSSCLSYGELDSICIKFKNQPDLYLKVNQDFEVITNQQAPNPAKTYIRGTYDLSFEEIQKIQADEITQVLFHLYSPKDEHHRSNSHDSYYWISKYDDEKYWYDYDPYKEKDISIKTFNENKKYWISSEAELDSLNRLKSTKELKKEEKMRNKDNKPRILTNLNLYFYEIEPGYLGLVTNSSDRRGIKDLTFYTDNGQSLVVKYDRHYTISYSYDNIAQGVCSTSRNTISEITTKENAFPVEKLKKFLFSNVKSSSYDSITPSAVKAMCDAVNAKYHNR